MKQLRFSEEYRYKDDDEGIPVAVTLFYAGDRLDVTAKMDSGSAVCLFSREAGSALGIPVEQGIPIRLGGLAGTIEAFGHEVTLQTGQIAFQSLRLLCQISWPGTQPARTEWLAAQPAARPD